jgi:hypothetical protein
LKSINFSTTTLLCAVHKLSSTFSDDIGNSVTGNGTGFWLTTKQGAYFVTNRHNVDPTMHGDKNSYGLASLTIWLRAFSLIHSLPCKDVCPLALSAKEFTIYWPIDKSDVVLLKPEKLFAPNDSNYQLLSLPVESTVYSRKPEILDQLYFLGFPANLRATATYDLPIARSCTIASFPEIDYSDEDKTIGSSQTCLVEGLSFGGSSGSVAIRKNDERLEVMGIMSGHFKGEKWGESHSGLSYLTKATSIQEIIKEHSI